MPSTLINALGYNRPTGEDAAPSSWFTSTRGSAIELDRDGHVSVHTSGNEARAMVAHSGIEDPYGLLVAALTMGTIWPPAQKHLISLAMTSEYHRMVKNVKDSLELSGECATPLAT